MIKMQDYSEMFWRPKATAYSFLWAYLTSLKIKLWDMNINNFITWG